ncbi:MAG: hypothetical protein NTV57_16185 [Cyanobacteria bacterium]|nr:hypothetical protein [Cyanobacteriota bacterium]
MADQLTKLRQLAAARPWRRSALDPASASDLTAKLSLAVEQQQPIRFSVPFGGYKGWRQPTAPWPNWAEVFWLAHLRRYGERLSAVHRPGMEISLSYCSGVLAAINNLPEVHQATYTNALAYLCRQASTAGVRFALVDIAALLGGPDAALQAVQQRISELRPRWQEGLPDGAERLASASRNLVPQGVEDLSGLSPEAWQARAAEAALGCWALESLEPRRDFNRGNGRIQISHRRGRGPQLHLSSCHTSTLQPWVGSGYLEPDGQGGWRPRIQASAQVRRWLTLLERGPGSMPGLRQLGIL